MYNWSLHDFQWNERAWPMRVSFPGVAAASPSLVCFSTKSSARPSSSLCTGVKLFLGIVEMGTCFTIPLHLPVIICRLSELKARQIMLITFHLRMCRHVFVAAFQSFTVASSDPVFGAETRFFVLRWWHPHLLCPEQRLWPKVIQETSECVSTEYLLALLR